MEALYYSRMNSPVGILLLAVSERGLLRLEFDRDSERALPANWILSEENTAGYVRQIKEYFSGARQQFDFALDLRGTEFQKRCWQALLDIPYGETRSYGDIARAIGKPHAFRAVGMANHHNPIAIVVPCHRVIASNGTLCGYGGGLNVKEQLLQLEKKTNPVAAERAG
jgi:methylated-DNA-[protein]-cysteine S-methyltransferase